MAVLFEVIDIPAGAGIPYVRVALIDAVNFPAARRADIFVRKKEFSEARIESEAMNAVAGRIDHHRARAVNEVTRGNLIAAPLKTVFDITVGRMIRNSSMDGEDRADAGIHIDVRR